MVDYIKNTGVGFAAASVAGEMSGEKMSMVWLALISAATQVALKFLDVYKRNREHKKHATSKH